MQTRTLLFLIIISSFVVFGCTQNQQQQQESQGEDLNFKNVCQNAGYEWMLMKPTEDGKFIKESESCWGCMVEGIEHVCDMETFNEMMKKSMEDSNMEDSSMEEGMHAIQHMAMTAHAGTRSTVDVHMYKVGFERPIIEPGQEALLKFTIKEISSKKPVANLEIVHDRIMHVALVRDDLGHFDHIHPEMTEPGVFSVPYKFPASGLYRIWIDFTIDGMQHIVDFDVNVPGNIESEENNLLDGIKVDFVPQNELRVDKEMVLKFEIFDSSNKPVPITQKFLAANAHLIAIDETLEEFGHSHDEKFDNDNKISFVHTFSKPGKHKIWVQFSKDGAAKTASFEVVVK